MTLNSNGLLQGEKTTVIKTVGLVLLPNTSLSFSRDLQTIFTYKGLFQKKQDCDKDGGAGLIA